MYTTPSILAMSMAHEYLPLPLSGTRAWPYCMRIYLTGREGGLRGTPLTRRITAGHHHQQQRWDHRPEQSQVRQSEYSMLYTQWALSMRGRSEIQTRLV